MLSDSLTLLTYLLAYEKDLLIELNFNETTHLWHTRYIISSSRNKEMSPLIHLSQQQNYCEESPGEILACRVILTLGLLLLVFIGSLH